MRHIAPQRVASSHRRRIVAVMIGGAILAISLTCVLNAAEYVSGIPWPEPKVVNPGPAGGPPSDAIVLFDGRDLSQWVGGNDWLVQDGYAISAKHDIYTKRSFGNCQLHVEWATPEKVEGDGQGRGNSGVFMMSTIDALLRNPNPRFVPESHLFRRPGRVHLQATPAAGERLPQAGPMAKLRHRFRGATLRSQRQAPPTGVRHHSPERRPGAESHGDCGHHGLGQATAVYGPSGQAATVAPVPSQSGPLPQHLDS